MARDDPISKPSGNLWKGWMNRCAKSDNAELTLFSLFHCLSLSFSLFLFIYSLHFSPSLSSLIHFLSPSSSIPLPLSILKRLSLTPNSPTLSLSYLYLFIISQLPIQNNSGVKFLFALYWDANTTT